MLGSSLLFGIVRQRIMIVKTSRLGTDWPASDGDGEGLVPYPPCLTFAEEVDVDDQTPNKSMTPAAAQVATLTSLPFASTVKNGLVAIIDIVGYTRLTNFLDEYSGSGGALVRDLLNKPFTKIIERIHAHSGSIVKFAGDAVIVSWSPPYNTETTENNALLLCSKAVLCCIELLFLFRNYKINLPQSEEFQKLSAALEQQDQDDTTGNNYQSGFDSTGRNDAAYVQHRKYVTSRQIMSANSPASNRHGGAGSANRGGERPKTKARSLPLRIHIGLAFGEVSHVYLGELYASTSLSSLNQGRLLESKNHQHLSPIPSSQEQHASLQNEAQTARTEYVIAGEAVETAGKLLGLGKEGELMICAGTMQHINNMIMSYSEPGKKGAGSRFDLMNIIDKRGDAFLVSAATMMDEEKAKTLSNTLKKTKIPEDSKGSGEAFLNPNWNSELLHLSLAYLDESLAKFVQQHQSNFGWGGLSMGSTFAINASPTNNQGSKSSAQRGKGKFVRLAVGDNPLGGDKAQSSQLNPIANTTANVSMIGLAPYGINIDDASDYNQIRRVTIVFLRLTSFRVRDAASPSLLHIAQSVMIAALSSIRMFGGCLRQFNFDDKAATVLMVWGLEGFAHERGEAFYAISAALSLSKKIGSNCGERVLHWSLHRKSVFLE
ncbi:hypothetical protein BC829DRAFT_42805 [Chytridium lagenaria]|nr:hypothetical protein BC829DRAFT_42805 [Chytridium lagenaria]